MQIKKVTINNYRNLDGQDVSFADNCIFIVGENNLVKSNLLNVFQILFTCIAYKFNDLTDNSKPIIRTENTSKSTDAFQPTLLNIYLGLISTIY